MKKWIISLSVILFFCGIRFSDVWFLEMVRLKALDQHQRSQQETITDKIVTVEIDNDSVREYGQWPWARDKLAGDIENLYRRGAAIVVLPILFADKDRLGGDAQFDEMLRKTPTIIGQIPANQTKGNPVPRGVAAIGMPWQQWIYNYSGAVGPIEPFSKSAIGVGMMLIAPENDGVVRRMPLVIQIDGQLYPSLSMEILRTAAGDISYQMKTGEGGVEALRIPKYKKILTDANGAIWIDFKWKTKTYALNKLTDNDSFVGKIVILSPTASGIDNPVATPVGVIQSHDLIAASVTTMMTGRNITRPFWTDLAEVSVSLVLSLVLTVVVLTLSWYFGAILLPVFLAGTYYGSLHLFTEYSYLVDWSYPVLTMFVVWSVAAFLRFMEEFRLRQQIKKQFEHYLDPRQVAALQKNPEALKLGGERKEMSFLFMDIIGFTPISEYYKNKDDPEGLVELVNEFLDHMTKILLNNGAMVDKFMGDCIMAVFNAPIDMENHAEMAVKSAIEIEAKTKELKVLYKERGLPDINVGTGVNTGTAIVGNMGSSTRFDFSVIGDAVNLAARLEATAGRGEFKNCPTLYSSHTMIQLENIISIEVDKIKVKGKDELITIYKPIDNIVNT
mgnify:FL=1